MGIEFKKMDVIYQRIAIICNYELLEDRVGEMDYFFWAFNKKGIEKNIKVSTYYLPKV